MNKSEIIYVRIVLVITFTIGLACGFIAGFFTNQDFNYEAGFKDGQANWTKVEGIKTTLTDTCFQTSPCGSEFVAIQYCIKNISREDIMKDKFMKDYLIYECEERP